MTVDEMIKYFVERREFFSDDIWDFAELCLGTNDLDILIAKLRAAENLYKAAWPLFVPGLDDDTGQLNWDLHQCIQEYERAGNEKHG